MEKSLQIPPFVVSLIFLLFSATIATCQKTNQSTNLVKVSKASQLIYTGNIKSGEQILSHIEGDSSKDILVFKAIVLKALIAHLNGNHQKAINILEKLCILPIIRQNNFVNDRIETVILLSDCYYAMFQIEEYKKIADTILKLSKQPNCEQKFKIRAFLTAARYYNYHIQTPITKSYIDSAEMIYSSCDNVAKEYNIIFLLSTKIQYVRNYKRYNLSSIINDSILTVLKEQQSLNPNDKIIFWRTLGNYYLDNCQTAADWKLNRQKPWYGKAMVCYHEAESIFERFFPDNKVDRIILYNLKGLINYNCAYFDLAKKDFANSMHILSPETLPYETHLPYYIDTYSLTIGLIDSLYKGKELVAEKIKQLKIFQQIASFWDKWEIANKRLTLNYSRDIFLKSAYNYIVTLCYDLFELTKNKEYINVAFEAQEHGKYQSILAHLKQTYRNYPKIEVDIIKIQKLIPSNETIFSFSDTHSNLHYLYAILISKDTCGFFRFNSSLFDNNYSGYREAKNYLKNLLTFKNTYYSAYQVLFKPAEKYLNKRINTLILFASNYSSQIKYDLLLADTTGYQSFASLPYLGNKFNIKYNYSYSIYQLQNRQQKNKCISVSQAYIPDYSNTNQSELPFFQALAQDLRKESGFDCFVNKSASLANYKKNVGKSDVLIVAGHGYSDQTSTDNQRIILDGENKKESFYLKPVDIINTPLQADLTCLALCESGISDIDVTDATLNMAYWFSYAGSKSCLYSYWKLDDRATSKILKKLFFYLQKGKSKSQALWLAKKEYLAETISEEEKNPIYWGGLEIIGDDAVMCFQPKNKFSYWYILFSGVAILLILFRRKLLPK